MFKRFKVKKPIALIVAAVLLVSSMVTAPIIGNTIKESIESASKPTNSSGTLSEKDKSKPKEQLASLNEQIEKDSDNPELYISRAAVLSKLQKYDEALNDYAAAIKLDPQPETYYLRALCHVLNSDNTSAYDDLKVALKSKPDDVDYLSLMADVCSATGKYEEGLGILEKLIAKDPKNALLHSMAGDACVNLSKHAKAIEYYDNALNNYTDETKKSGVKKESIYAAKGNCYKSEEEFEKAIKEYDKSLEIAETKSVYFQRGYCYIQLGKYNEAITDFTASIDKNYEVPISKFQRGLCYYSVGKYKEAVADFTAYETAFPKKSDSYLYHGLSLQGLKKYDEAITYLEKSLAAGISVGDCNFNIGNCYYNQEKYAEAIPFYTKAIEAEAQVYAAYLNRGNAYLKNNKYNEAKADLKKVIDECTDKSLVEKASKSYEPIKNITIITKK